ncbi:hypothetical protein MGMO_37c00210 [Methyloglobulus morosus KoM1]|uniref:Uncharacterized protein n=1 Tax=Methyloglobulus morosus KoM1 TaxID=1116472 RepID=V5BIF2_9GAMM|nr:hypothetical protein MGMO_37c00210 [Methyloglobulus morosus KoM1]
MARLLKPNVRYFDEDQRSSIALGVLVDKVEGGIAITAHTAFVHNRFLAVVKHLPKRSSVVCGLYPMFLQVMLHRLTITLSQRLYILGFLSWLSVVLA